MANLRNLKKEIDYRLEEFVFDCEMAIYFQPNKEDEVVKLMEKAVELRNALYVKANNPDEPKNASLVRKYYAAMRRDMVASFEGLFGDLSALNKESCPERSYRPSATPTAVFFAASTKPVHRPV